MFYSWYLFGSILMNWTVLLFHGMAVQLNIFACFKNRSSLLRLTKTKLPLCWRKRSTRLWRCPQHTSPPPHKYTLTFVSLFSVTVTAEWQLCFVLFLLSLNGSITAGVFFFPPLAFKGFRLPKAHTHNNNNNNRNKAKESTLTDFTLLFWKSENTYVYELAVD